MRSTMNYGSDDRDLSLPPGESAMSNEMIVASCSTKGNASLPAPFGGHDDRQATSQDHHYHYHHMRYIGTWTR